MKEKEKPGSRLPFPYFERLMERYRVLPPGVRTWTERGLGALIFTVTALTLLNVTNIQNTNMSSLLNKGYPYQEAEILTKTSAGLGTLLATVGGSALVSAYQNRYRG